MHDGKRVPTAVCRDGVMVSEELLPTVYDELRRLAAAHMVQEKPGQTLQATALVHEAWIRLIGSGRTEWDGRGHFFAAAAEAMRRILIENARRKKRLRHGGGQHRVDLDSLELACGMPSDELLALDEALALLLTVDPVPQTPIRCPARHVREPFHTAARSHSPRTVPEDILPPAPNAFGAG